MRATADSVVMTGGALGDRIMKDGSSAPTVSTLRKAIINAIGGKQKYCDYRTSMKYQRDCCTMEMGPLLQAIADGDTVAFVYEMYLTPKGMENAPPLR